MTTIKLSNITPRDRKQGFALVHTKTGQTVNIGDTITDFRGDTDTLTDWLPGATPQSSGRVFVESGRSYYPSVCDLAIIPSN